MNWNQKNGCWAELKGQAKRQSQVLESEVNELTSTKQAQDGREILWSIQTIKTGAETQLSELEDLLQIMQSYRSINSNAAYRKTFNPEKSEVTNDIGIASFES